MSNSDQSKKRLRKQPKMKRVYSTSAVPMPQMSMPKTVKKRKRRNSQQKIQQPLSSVKRVVFSTRWLSLGLLALAVYALITIGRDERFYLDYIPVEGTGAVPPSEIVEASGLAGRNVFAADPQAAADAVAEVPGVISSTVTLRWPSDVTIQVREQSPLAIWQEGDASYWVVEGGGLIPARVETVGLLQIISEGDDVVKRAGMTGIPAYLMTEIAEDTATDETEETEVTAEEGAAENSEETDEPVAKADAAFVPADVLEGAMQLRQLRPNIDKLYYRPSGGLSYQDGRGWRAYFGSGRDMHQKLVVYEQLVEDLLSRGLQPTYISVSNQEKPFYKLAP
ncbi:MAG: FtsQ-type POTRA domain-containing protein [Chloroflexota bacterium]